MAEHARYPLILKFNPAMNQSHHHEEKAVANRRIHYAGRWALLKLMKADRVSSMGTFSLQMNYSRGNPRYKLVIFFWRSE